MLFPLLCPIIYKHTPKHQTIKPCNNIFYFINPSVRPPIVRINIIMYERSHLLMRPKQELKNQLLMGFRKKNKDHIIDLQNSEKIARVCSTPTQSYQNRSFAQNNTILDEFSRCPLRDDQITSGETFLNKFLFTKKQVAIGNSAKTSVSVQTQKNNEQTRALNSNVGFSKERGQSVVPKTRTPRVADFDEKAEQSLIDISGNISSYKYPISGKKYPPNHNILTDSILDHQKMDKSEDSADELLNQLENADESLSFQKVESEGSEKDRKEPIVKKIQLKPKSKPESQNVYGKQNENKNKPTKEDIQPIQEDQKLEKLLAKKSVIKSLIVNKNLEDARQKERQKQKQKQKQKLIPVKEMGISKWGKTNKKSSNNYEPNERRLDKKNIQQQEYDPLDQLPPYESSLSGLQAVIEQQNESELEESVKNKQKLQPLPEYRPISLKQIAEKKQPAIEQCLEKPQKNSESKFQKSISIGDLSLDDVSVIENVSGNKKLPDSFKKLQSAKDLSEELPAYEDSQNQETKAEPHVQIQKYIVNDIANDINNLKKKISEDISFLGNEVNEENNHGQDQKLKVQKSMERRKPSSGKGSEGVDKKMASMLDFFDELNDKLDFSQISRDINELRDRIANDSQ